MFNDDDETEEMPEGLKKMLGIDAATLKKKKDLSDFSEKKSEEIENEILMPLWADLGDLTETYWQAIQACHLFTEVRRKTLEGISGMDPKVFARILRALSESFAAEAQLLLKMHEIAE